MGWYGFESVLLVFRSLGAAVLRVFYLTVRIA